MEVYEVVFTSPELKTVADYVAEPGSPALKYINREEEFLAVKNKQGITNKESILSRYKNLNLRDKYEKLPAKQIPIKIGTILAIPAEQIDRVGLLTQGIEVVDNNVPAFKARMLAELEAKEGYNPARKIKPNQGQIEVGTTVDSYPEVTVWVWCRALSGSKLNEDNQGEIFNVTPFVTKVTTNTGKGGGNFSFSLPALMCEQSSDGKWTIKKSTITNYKPDARNLTQQNDGYVANASLINAQDGQLRRSQFLFHNILSTNDLVFIRFETLELEKQQRIDDGRDFTIDKSQIPGRIYDMIGLIDSNTQTVDGGGIEVNTNIQGRDLSKLFIEDGTYFYALEMSQGQLNFAGGSNQQNELMQRVFSENSLQYFGLYFNNSIENVFKFVIQQLSTIKVVPDELFQYYGERRNKKYNQERKQLEQPKAISDQLIALKNQSLSSVKSVRRLTNSANKSSLEEDREVLTIWNECYAFFKAIRSTNARIVSGNITTGWNAFKYASNRGIEDLDANRFSHSFLDMKVLDYSQLMSLDSSLIGSFDKYIDLEVSSPSHKDIWKEEIAPGIWQIIKLVIDESITERRIVDSSASSANGSLINFFAKVCQEPFVEFYMDTYGDMFHLIARRPPINGLGVMSMLEGQVRVDSEDGTKREIKSTVIDIEIEDVIQEQLSYDDNDVFTWYHLTPQANFIGNSSTYSLAYLPAIFFQEYAEIWGSRPLQISHNYMPRLPLNAQQTSLDITERQAYDDLAFLVESHAYLPFTRKGNIILNGDRRLKIGNICRYKPTGEIFFIDSVQQSFGITDNYVDRTTNIGVSRGMVEDLITGIPLLDDQGNSGDKVASYFNIIDTDLVIEEHTVKETIREQIKVGTRMVPSGLDPGGAKQEKITQTPSTNVNGRAAFKAKIGSAESGGRVTNSKGEIIKNPYGSAKGKYQIINSTWRMIEKGLGRKLNIYSPADNETAMDYLLDRYQKALVQAKLELNGTNFYALHFKGSTGWIKAAYNTPNASVWSYFSEAEIKSNPVYMSGGTVGSVIAKLAKKMAEPVKYSYTPTGEYQEDVYEYKETTITRQEIDRAKVFSKFIVFKPCFNFLLRRKQNNPKILGTTNRIQSVVLWKEDFKNRKTAMEQRKK